MPKVTVLMPVYNASAYLQEAIQSILNQTFQEFIDDLENKRYIFGRSWNLNIVGRGKEFQ